MAAATSAFRTAIVLTLGGAGLLLAGCKFDVGGSGPATESGADASRADVNQLDGAGADGGADATDGTFDSGVDGAPDLGDGAVDSAVDGAADSAVDGATFDSDVDAATDGAIDGAVDAADIDAAQPDAAVDAAAIDAQLSDSRAADVRSDGRPVDARNPDAAMPLPGEITATLLGPQLINIDGQFDDWPADSALRPYIISDSAPNAHDHVSSIFVGDDLSGVVAATYDSQGVFVRAEVRDDTYDVGSTNLYFDDTFDLYIDRAPLGGEYGNEDRRYYFRANGDAANYAGSPGNYFNAGSPALDNVVWAVTRTNNRYRYELFLPWSVLGFMTQPVAGTKMRFGMQLTDDDLAVTPDDPHHWLTPYRGSSQCSSCCASTHKDVWCDPTTLGSLVLAP